jgi:hypothetical protein
MFVLIMLMICCILYRSTEQAHHYDRASCLDIVRKSNSTTDDIFLGLLGTGAYIVALYRLIHQKCHMASI